VREIIREHPEYAGKVAITKKYRDLYTGGEQLRANGAEYLVRRHKEALDVYSERLNRVFYENYAGSIIDWYAATLFRREPLVIIDGDDDLGRRFFNRFAEDCDFKGTCLSDFFRRHLIDMLVAGASYFVVDFPRSRMPAANRAEEEARGTSRAYLVAYGPEEIINWSRDERDNYEWVVIRTKHLRKQRVEDQNWVAETRWTVYDRQRFQVYRMIDAGDGKGEIELIDSGLHGMAKQNTVPLFEIKVSDGLWLMNKAGSLQLEHFNKSNALAWAITMGLFAMPVIYSDREWKQIVGESYYVQLGPDDRFGWTEPEGHVYQLAADNLARLKEEIYRVCYLLSHAGPVSSGLQQSGLSKLRDFAITQEVLRAYGDVIKDAMKKALRGIAQVREDVLEIDVSGLDDFDIGDFGSELAEASQLLGLGIKSDTLRKQIYKKLAFKYLCDVRQETKDRIAQEIDISCDKAG
jgi:hypothetical protein